MSNIDLFNKRIIIFGASEKNYAEQIIQKYGNQVAYCIDNDARKHNTKFRNEYTIYPVEHILQESSGTYMVIIVTTYWSNRLAAQLLEMGLERNRDFVIARDVLDGDSLIECWDKNKPIKKKDYLPELRVLHLEYSGICNLKCTYCPYHGEYSRYKGNKGMLTFDTLKIIVEKCKRATSIDTLNLCGRGEIFVNKHWYEFTNYVLDEIPIKNLRMYTNGMLLTTENADKLALLKKRGVHLILVVSIDGETPEQNNDFRVNSNYDIIKKNIINALEFLEADDIEIYNSHLIGRSDLERRNGDVSFGMSVPDFILKDFPNLNSLARPVFNMTPEKEMFVLGEEHENTIVRTAYKSSCCEYLFGALSFDNEGKILKCSCSVSVNPYLGDAFDDDPLDIFYNHGELKTAREMALDSKCPELCRFCPDNPGKWYFAVTKKSSV